MSEQATKHARADSCVTGWSSGDAIPRVEYRDDEIATWRAVYAKLDQLFESHACKQHIKGFRQMERECGYSRERIPQLEDISRYLKSKSSSDPLSLSSCARLPP